MFIANVPILCVRQDDDLKFQSLVESYSFQNYMCIFSLLNERLTYDS